MLPFYLGHTAKIIAPLSTLSALFAPPSASALRPSLLPSSVLPSIAYVPASRTCDVIVTVRPPRLLPLQVELRFLG